MECHFIPGYLLERLAQAPDEALAECGRRTAAIDERCAPGATAVAAAGRDG